MKSDDEFVLIALPFDLAEEAAKFHDCYAPILRAIARECFLSVHGAYPPEPKNDVRRETYR